MSDSKTSISERIRAARGRSGLTLKDVASKCEVSSQLVCKWEHGQSFPNSSCLIVMSKILDCSVEWLLDPSPLDFHSTETAPQGKHAKYWVRAVLEELAEEAALKEAGE